MRQGGFDFHSRQHAGYADRLPPDLHIYTESKQPWVVLGPEIPAEAAYYERRKYWPAHSLERLRVLSH